jgi:hypothetical protein
MQQVHRSTLACTGLRSCGGVARLQRRSTPHVGLKCGDHRASMVGERSPGSRLRLRLRCLHARAALAGPDRAAQRARYGELGRRGVAAERSPPAAPTRCSRSRSSGPGRTAQAPDVTLSLIGAHGFTGGGARARRSPALVARPPSPPQPTPRPRDASPHSTRPAHPFFFLRAVRHALLRTRRR